MEGWERDRETLATKLHDDILQGLGLLTMRLATLQKRVSREELPIAAEVQAVCSELERVSGRVRGMAQGVFPAALEELGFIPALESFFLLLGEGVAEGPGTLEIALCLEGLDERSRMPPDREMAIYRLVQEGVTNILKHAHATRAEVCITWKGNQATAAVRDNGKGIDLKQVREALRLGHFGLWGLRQRVEALGGSLDIGGGPPGWSQIRGVLPMSTSTPLPGQAARLRFRIPQAECLSTSSSIE